MRLIPEGTVLLTSRAPIGKAAIAGTDMYCNQGFKNLLCSDEIHNKYLYWFLKGKSDYLNSLGRGATFKEISKAIVEDIQVPLPAKEVQIQIAREFDAVSALMALHKRQLEELDQLIKSVFYEMFGDPVANEKGWEIKSIGSVFQVETGATPSRGNSKYYEDATIPWVKTGEIEQGYIFNTDEMISQLAIQETNCKLFPQNTVLIAMYGQGKTRGRAGLLKISAATNQACAAILPSESFNAEFLYRYLSINYETLRALGRGGNQENLNLSMIRDFKLISPPLSMQNNFTDIVSQIESQKSLVKQSIDEAQRLFDSLMSQYFDD